MSFYVMFFMTWLFAYFCCMIYDIVNGLESSLDPTREVFTTCGFAALVALIAWVVSL